MDSSIEISDKPFHELIYRSSGQRGQVCNVVLPFYRAKVDALPKGFSSFVVTSDLQGREIDTLKNRLVGEVVAEELFTLYELDEIPYVNFVALAGDLYDYPKVHKRGGTGDVTSVWNAFAQYFDFVVGVMGNHDTVQQSEMCNNTLILDGTSTNIQSITIGGVSGIVGRIDRNQRKTEEQFIKSLTKVTRANNDLILLHQGPEDRKNDQLGDPKITDYLQKNGTNLVVFGHCHWEKPYQEIGKNQVLNVDNRVYVVTA